MIKIELEENSKKVLFSGDWSIEDPLIYEKLQALTEPARVAFLEKAIKLGTYTLSISDVQVGLLGVVKDLDAKLIHLKHAFDVRNIRDESAGRGAVAEVNLFEHFERFFENSNDSVVATGATVGAVPRRKVGDFEIRIAGSERIIALESKFDKSKTKGSVESATESQAVGQVLLSSANRQAHYSIFIAEEGSSTAKSIAGGIEFDPQLAAFYVVVNPKTNNYVMLDTAIEIARSLTLALDTSPEVYQHVLLCSALLISESTKIASIADQLSAMRKSATSIISATEKLEASISEGIGRINEISEFLNGIGSQDISEQEQRLKRLELVLKKAYK